MQLRLSRSGASFFEARTYACVSGRSSSLADSRDLFELLHIWMSYRYVDRRGCGCQPGGRDSSAPRTLFQLDTLALGERRGAALLLRLATSLALLQGYLAH